MGWGGVRGREVGERGRGVGRRTGCGGEGEEEGEGWEEEEGASEYHGRFGWWDAVVSNALVGWLILGWIRHEPRGLSIKEGKTRVLVQVTTTDILMMIE